MHGDKFLQAKKVSISTGLRDQNLAKGRPNSTFWEGSDKVQFGVGRKEYPLYTIYRGIGKIPLVADNHLIREIVWGLLCNSALVLLRRCLLLI